MFESMRCKVQIEILKIMGFLAYLLINVIKRGGQKK